MRIRQIVFAAGDLGAASALLARLFDLEAPYRDPGVAEFGLDNAVFAFGDQFIEVVSPLRDGTAAGRLIERRSGDTGYMLIVQTDDLAHDRERFATLGVRTVFEADFPDIAAVHLHPRDIGGAIVSVDQPTPPASWRWGGPRWRVQSGDRGAQRIVGLTVEAKDPEAMARRWSQVLGLAPPVAVATGRWRVSLDGSTADFVVAGDRGDGISGFALAVVDRAGAQGRARDAGLPVDDDGFVVLGTRITLRSP